MTQLDLLAETVDAPDIRARLEAAGVWRPPDRIGEPTVATYCVRVALDGEVTVTFCYRRSEGRSPALTIAVHALVGAARIELGPMP